MLLTHLLAEIQNPLKLHLDIDYKLLAVGVTWCSHLVQKEVNCVFTSRTCQADEMCSVLTQGGNETFYYTGLLEHIKCL